MPRAETGQSARDGVGDAPTDRLSFWSCACGAATVGVQSARYSRITLYYSESEYGFLASLAGWFCWLRSEKFSCILVSAQLGSPPVYMLGSMRSRTITPRMESRIQTAR